VNEITAGVFKGSADSVSNGQESIGRRAAWGGSMSFAGGLKTIVVATDLEGHSEAALEYARKIAKYYEARIVLAYVLDPLEYAAVAEVPGEVRGELSEKAQAVLNTLAGDLIRAGIHSHTELRQGTVTQMLVDVAKQYGAGLIVVGTKGIEGAGPVVVGVIAEQLVRLAPCAVLAVAADWNAGEFRPTPGGPVLLAMEHNEAAAEAVSTAYSLAETFERPLLVLHAREEVGGIEDPCAASIEEFGILSTDKVPVRCMVKNGKPAEAVAEAIDENQPCILVVGAKRSSETPGPHGTAFALLARSRVPVLCVPPEAA
jgi:nucleotide-binding universal stress UspA family protein